MILQMKDADGEGRLGDRDVRSGGFKSHQEFMIYLGWLRLFRRISTTKQPREIMGDIH